ncbi:UNVERIFIED_CONTAM: hypothetical protein FKN15_013847 [Acipenser sinensis]
MTHSRKLTVQEAFVILESEEENAQEVNIEPPELLKKRFLSHVKLVRQIDFIKCTVAYYGHHGCKQFIRGKSIRIGYIVWCLSTNLGYLVNYDVYQCKNPHGNTEYEKKFGNAASPLMIHELPDKFPLLF